MDESGYVDPLKEKHIEQTLETQQARTAGEKSAAALQDLTDMGIGVLPKDMMHHKKKDTKGDRAKFEEEIIMLFGRLCAIEKDISKLKKDTGELCTSYFYGKCDFSL